VTANGSGETAEFEVRPRPIPGMAEDDVVNLKKPCAEFRMLPGTYDATFSNTVGTLSFQAIQKL
jgi:hypothetical protein